MTTLELSPRSLRFVPQDVVAPVGPQLLVDAVLRHAPPTALEAETAIEVIEDAVMPLHRRLPGGGELLVRGGAEVQALLQIAGATLDADTIEALFTRAAAVAQGRPAASEPVLAQPAVFACLLILREVLHHLGFPALRLER
ncbi:hypothetical protein LZ009_03965 [Ramlibacter sp. XY19]|uniref:hypothetical protein n=1 Tax=Ramlibacter paludis TaxID=2908000 RepID=UPI0023DB5177|nr:hypothetical protein [Ramlibacter paludis]MCG2591929.1 hypothetical protein [Ramlibacter paludis]